MKNNRYIIVMLMAFAFIVAGVIMFSRTADPAASTAEVAQAPQDMPTMQAQTPPPIPTGPHAKIEFAEMTHDFGKQMSNSELKIAFKFINKGDATLVIDKVKAG